MAEEVTTQDKEKEVVEQENQSLENFDWDTTGEGDFFGIKGTAPEATEVEEVVKKVKEDSPEEEEQEAEEEEQETFFEVEEEKEKDNEQEEGDDFFKTLSQNFKEKGIFQNIEIPEGEEITEEKFIELQDSEIEARVDEALEGFLEELDEDAAAFLKFKKEGGNTQDFFKVYGQNTSTPQGDIEDEAFQEKLNRYYYKNVEGLDEEDINDKLEWLKDSGKLQKYAEKHDEKLKELDKESKEDLQKKAKEQEKLQEEARQKFVDSVQQTLEETDEIDNFKFPEKEKKELHAFITKPTIKVAKNRYVTGMQSSLQEALKDPKKMLVLAKLLKNNFAVDDIVATTTTKATKKLKDDLQRVSRTVRPSSSGKSNKRRNLADFF